jgi:hypothetical protein
MATLPTYEYAGAQYADLPRVNTAPQQVAAQGFNVLSQQLDRMTAFFQNQAVTDAQAEGLKYAVQNPLTKDQIDTALRTPEGVTVKGGGKIFQQTYQKAQAVMLSSELQLEGQKTFASMAAAIEAGAQFDMRTIQANMKDMIDGYSSSVMALDPEQSIRLRSALTSAGNALYVKAAERTVKVQQAQYDARLEEAVVAARPLIEAIVAKSGTIDPSTGTEVDVNKLLEIQKQPFYEAIKITGNNKHIAEINKAISEAKISAVVSRLKDKTIYDSPTKALDALDKGDVGQLTSLYKGLTEADKSTIQDKVLKDFANIESARKLQKAKDDDNNQRLAIELRDQFYQGKISSSTLISGLKALDQLKADEIKSLRTEQRDAKPEVFGRYQSMAAKNMLGESDLDELAKSGTISWKQRNELAKDVRNNTSDMAKATTYVNSALGVPDPLTPGFHNERKRAAEVRTQLLEEQQTALMEGKPFNPMARAQELTKQKLSSDEVKMQEQIKSDLRKNLADLNLRYDENYTDESLKRAGVSNSDDRKKIMRKINALKGPQ